MYYKFWALYEDGTILEQRLAEYKTPRLKLHDGKPPRFRAFAADYGAFLDAFDRRGVDLPDELLTADPKLITLYDVYEAGSILYTYIIVADIVYDEYSRSSMKVCDVHDIIMHKLVNEHSNEFHTLQYWHNKIAAGTIAYIESL